MTLKIFQAGVPRDRLTYEPRMIREEQPALMDTSLLDAPEATTRSLTILLSHERSGSHFVGEYLGNLDCITKLDEVANPQAVTSEWPVSYHGFRTAYATRKPEFLSAPTWLGQKTFLEEYFQHVLRLMAPMNVVIDVKYGHIVSFEMYWWELLGKPTLFSVAGWNNVRILHLYRNNVVEAAASAMIAEARKVWHSLELTEGKKDAPVELDSTKLVRAAKLLQTQVGWVREMLADYPLLFSLSYERAAAELYTGGELDKELAEFVGGELGADEPTRQYKKVTPPLSKAISNWDAVRADCIAAGLGKHVGASRLERLLAPLSNRVRSR